MINPVLLVDTWEGGGEIDEAVLLANNVAGMIVRLNDISGGHHVDENFYIQWEQARVLPVRIVYWVYNPWKNGQENYDWLIANLPAECGAVMVDVEVIKTGYPAATYGTEFFKFHLMLKEKLNVMIYTGEWFLKYLSTWPVNADYWFAAYPLGLYQYETITWDALRTRLIGYDYPSNKDEVPGVLKMWQFTGDRMILPGCSKRMDINVFYGTLDELKSFANEKPTPPVQVGDTLLSSRQYFDGAVEKQYEINTDHGKAIYNLTEIKTDKVGSFFVTPLLDGRRYVPKWALLYNLDIAINLGGWTIEEGVLTPTGSNASDGQPYGKNPNYEKIIYIDKQNRFSFNRPSEIWTAFSIQNELVVDGIIPYIDKPLKEYRGRTAIGWNKEQTMVYFLTVDGGDVYDEIGLNFLETAEILLGLGCWYGAMLDGGGSTTKAINVPEGL